MCTFGKLVFNVNAPFHNKETYETKLVTKQVWHSFVVVGVAWSGHFLTS